MRRTEVAPTERRRFKRVRPAPGDKLEIQLIADGFIDFCSGRDISEGGASICVPHGFRGCNINAEIELVIKLPSHKPFRVAGRICHLSDTETSKGFFGILFTSIPGSALNAIRAYVARRLEESGEVG